MTHLRVCITSNTTFSVISAFYGFASLLNINWGYVVLGRGGGELTEVNAMKS